MCVDYTCEHRSSTGPPGINKDIKVHGAPSPEEKKQQNSPSIPRISTHGHCTIVRKNSALQCTFTDNLRSPDDCVYIACAVSAENRRAARDLDEAREDR